MIIKEYCDSMEKQLTAWRSNVQKLLMIAERLPSGDQAADAGEIRNLEEIIEGLGRVTEKLKRECLPA